MTADPRGMLEGWLTRLGSPPEEIVETHASVVAIAGDRVYKMKKPVRFAFLDLSTPQRRLEVCQREVELNRRLAPDVYRGVVEVTDESGRAVDHAVEMVRLPQDRRLDQLLAGPEARVCLDRLAIELARFHAAQRSGIEVGAATGADGPATPQAVAQLWQASLDELAPFAGSVLAADAIARARRLATRYVAGRSRLFQLRLASGCVVDGHGDLRADDVFCQADAIRVIDCLEFDDRLRWGDVLADVAFLAMDLEWLGHPELATAFLGSYRRATGGSWPVSLEHHWIAYRALVRAKVACLRVAAGVAAHQSARGHLDLALTHLRHAQVRLVVVGGLPGTGKSTLAAGIADRLGWRLIRSDVVRRAAPGPAKYTADAKGHVYEEVLAAARTALAEGESVLLDASWSDTARRDAAARVAAAAGSDFDQLHCVAPAAVTEARIRDRARTGSDESEADVTVARAMAEEFDPWPRAIQVDTDADRDTVLERAVAILTAGSPRA